MAYTYQEINEKALRREFCGPNKRIPQELMAKLDRDIENAKRLGNRALKKQLKRRHAAGTYGQLNH